MNLWLKPLPTMRPSNDEEVIDGGPLLDEVETLITFDRCLKTPYRYLEDVRSLTQTLTLLKYSIRTKSFVGDVSQLFAYDDRRTTRCQSG